MATKKTTKKKTKTSQGSRAKVKNAKAPTKKKVRIRTFTPKRKCRLLDKVLTNFEDRIDEEEIRPSVGEALRAIQLRDGIEPEMPSKIHVEWAELEKE